MKTFILTLLILTGCSKAALHSFNRSTFVASTSLIMCDWGQTHSAAVRGWDNYHEANPVLGNTPSTREVNEYFVTSLVVNTVAWMILPEKLKGILPSSIIVIQSPAIYGNFHTTPGVCGFR